MSVGIFAILSQLVILPIFVFTRIVLALWFSDIAGACLRTLKLEPPPSVEFRILEVLFSWLFFQASWEKPKDIRRPIPVLHIFTPSRLVTDGFINFFSGMVVPQRNNH
ncbi:unnamed protein product [Strongylus vulgaris]|uniref:Uncharacterized protein n=1 Tax=Strongylus vulgaris TaxID=40348 RepID=A0A3P7J0H6_STRVU|nr:unnamed protein product [Strongylus vulgaris]